jgi:hypothetical protein
MSAQASISANLGLQQQRKGRRKCSRRFQTVSDSNNIHVEVGGESEAKSRSPLILEEGLKVN